MSLSEYHYQWIFTYLFNEKKFCCFLLWRLTCVQSTLLQGHLQEGPEPRLPAQVPIEPVLVWQRIVLDCLLAPPVLYRSLTYIVQQLPFLAISSKSSLLMSTIGTNEGAILASVFRILDILVQIRILESVPLIDGSCSGSGSRASSFRQWSPRSPTEKKFSLSFYAYSFLKVYLHHSSIVKSHKEVEEQ
jgi:hypothetical protein